MSPPIISQNISFSIMVLLFLPFSCIGNEMWYLNSLKIGILSQQSKTRPPSPQKPNKLQLFCLFPPAELEIMKDEYTFH